MSEEIRKRLRRVHLGESKDSVYGTEPEIVDGPANSWYERTHPDAERQFRQDLRDLMDEILK